MPCSGRLGLLVQRQIELGSEAQTYTLARILANYFFFQGSQPHASARV